MEVTKLVMILFIVALISVNIGMFLGWLPNEFAVANIVIAGLFVASLFLTRKFLSVPGLEKTRKDALNFYKELVFGTKSVGANLNDIEGVEEFDRQKKRFEHSFVIEDANDRADVNKSLLIKLNPSGNPHSRLVGYHKGVATEAVLPLLSKLREKEEKMLPAKPKKESSKVDIRVKQEEKAKTEDQPK